MSFKDTFAGRLGYCVGPVLGNDSPSGEGFVKEFVFAARQQEGKNFECLLSQHVRTRYSGNAFHRPIPNR